MKSMSIKLRLSLLVSLLTFVIILVVCIVAYVELEESLLKNIDEILRATGEGIVATLDEHEDAAVREAEFQSIIGNGNSPGLTWCRIWIDGSTEDLFSSGLSAYPRRTLVTELLSGEQPEEGQASFSNVVAETDRDRRHPFRVLWIRRVQGNEVVNVLVGRSSHHVTHELTEFWQLLLIVGASLLLLGFLVAPFLVSWGLRPIAQEGARLQAITYKSLRPNRASSEAVPELKPFVEALDDMLVRLDKAMRQQEQFIADAAHELRTPVAVAKSTLQTIRLQRRTAGEYEESIEETLQDIGRLERLIEQLLSLARLEAPDTLRKYPNMRLDVMLSEMVETFNARAGGQNGRVVFSEASPTTVKGDENELRQLFSNLLDNALRHGPRGGTVHVTLEDGADDRVTVSVRDEGGQIPPDALAHLFDRFYRVDSSRSQASGGSGLGLAIAREIARRHGGDIAITSDSRNGTVVSVRLPRR